MVGEQQFEVVFFCPHSLQPGHEQFEISVTREWIATAAPWLKRCLPILLAVADSVLRVKISTPDLSFLDLCKGMQKIYDSLIEVGTQSQMQTLDGEGFKVIAEKAEEKESQWNKEMVCVNDENEAPIWVNLQYKKLYQVPVSSSEGRVEI